MKIVSQIQSVKVNLLNGLKFNAPAKLLGGLALGAILITSVALSSGTTPASPLPANPVPEAVRSSSDLGGGITDFEEPYVNAVRASAVEVQWDLEDIFNSSSTGLTSEPVEVQWDLEDMFNAVRSGSDLGGGITDFEEPYVNAVRASSDLGGGITDFEEPYVNAVRSSSDLGGGIPDDEWMFNSPYHQDFSNVGG